jgi:hypothetical protein
MIMSIENLKQYVAARYPHLVGEMTEAQYEQISWLDATGQTPQGVPSREASVSLQAERIFARLHFLALFKKGGDDSYAEFVAGQEEQQKL